MPAAERSRSVSLGSSAIASASVVFLVSFAMSRRVPDPGVNASAGGKFLRNAR
jgi:hypothetical protein